MTRLFGTDGVRGIANTHPMTPETAMAIGRAAGNLLCQDKHRRHTVVIGKDTRLSGYLLEPALTAGLISAGIDVVLLGPLPTPAVAMLTHSLRADMGVMITASHNPYQDNGIKLFGPDGYKLSDSQEDQIEALVANGTDALRVPSDALGRARRLQDGGGRYIEAVKRTFPVGMRLDGLKLVVDCANGAAYKVAPQVLWELGAEVIALGVEPNGTNINASCGSLHPENMRTTVIRERADLGIAFDGDADRLIICDENGIVVDGDQILALIARTMHARSLLTGGSVVGTLMSNLGLEIHLRRCGLTLERTAVGDRYVVERMREGGFNLGGEQSGHIVMSDFGTTGDGLMSALQVLAALVSENRPASEVLNVFAPCPQRLENIRVEGCHPDTILESPVLHELLDSVRGSLEGTGRVLVRKSGTEPLIRVMVEDESRTRVDNAIERICGVIRHLYESRN
ncbi:phosphoglucosamine mutase [Phaeovibrio sulfidiphilus]|uniref:Phosphoglucosamine mutase n=1 Tax=Phaeovibrio sulfidiphilus TaxID=1220600 RepID=A0A8J6YMN3_9PROT|nr:phosphoglucosamine mutase [Phaeovibrio sulfidiphilus]MBE1236116.1 phosphoglucosamine mutase [Phaeovibrio sulfidiphilus]